MIDGAVGRRGSGVLLVTLCLCAAGTPTSESLAAAGQAPFRSSVELVSLPVTVLNSDGRFVTGLTQSDFEVIEDGVRQEVTVFSSEPQPLAIAVAVDFSKSMRGERRTAALAAVRQVGAALAPADQWSLFAFADRVTMLTSWTAFEHDDGSRLQQVEAAGGTRLFEAVTEVQKYLRSAPHRKRALLVISDGNDLAALMGADFSAASSESVSDVGGGEQRAVNALRTGESLLYAIGMDWPYDSRSLGSRSPSKRVDRRSLDHLAVPTGGTVWMANTSDDLQAAAADLVAELRQQYTIGYSPARAPDGKYRRVRVMVKEPTYVVRSRTGYVAAKR
jgi:Ca-activated chloride channel family protein